jgi:hypothetical protein
MKYTQDDFLLPNGEPMSPDEIADMLNSMPGVPAKKEPQKHGDMGFNIAVPMRATDKDTEPAYTKIEIPAVDVMSKLYELVANADRGNLYPNGIVLGWNLAYSLEMQLNTAGKIYQHTSSPNSFVCQFGALPLFVSQETDELKLIFNTEKKGRLVTK